MFEITVNYLVTQNIYRSPKLRPSWFARKAPTWIFYSKMIFIVLKAFRLSKKRDYTSERWVQRSLDILKALESVGVIFEAENVVAFQDLENPCVFVSNHMSILETFVLPCLIQPHRDVTFVVKERLIRYPFFKHVMVSRSPIVVGRINPMNRAREILSLVVRQILLPDKLTVGPFSGKR